MNKFIAIVLAFIPFAVFGHTINYGDTIIDGGTVAITCDGNAAGDLCLTVDNLDGDTLLTAQGDGIVLIDDAGQLSLRGDNNSGNQILFGNTATPSMVHMGYDADSTRFQITNDTATLLWAVDGTNDINIADGLIGNHGTFSQGSVNLALTLSSTDADVDVKLADGGTTSGQEVAIRRTGDHLMLKPLANGGVSIGGVTPTAEFHVQGPGDTSGDYTAIFENASGADSLVILGDGTLQFAGGLAVTDNTLSSNTNTFLGVGAGGTSLTHGSGSEGWYNSGHGNNSLNSITTGEKNTFSGFSSGFFITTGESNVGNGYNALYSLVSGDRNVANGFNAGRYITGGATANETSGDSVYIGASTKASADGNTNETVIGYNATGGGSNTTMLGNASITNTFLGAGDLGATGTRVTKGWFTDLEVTNPIAAAVTGNAATATALETARTIGGVSFDGTANTTVSTATGGFTVSGGDLALGANNITMSGSIGVTGTRATKLWATDIESTNMPTVSGTSLDANGVITGPTAGEITQIEAIGATTISAGQWAYVGGADQAVKQADSPTFAGATLTGFSGIVKASTGTLSAAALDLTADVGSSVLPVANGGTNASGALSNDLVMISSSGTIAESATISTTELGYLDGQDQDLATADDVIFAGITNTGGEFTPPTVVNAATYDLLVTDSILHVTYTATGQ